MNNEKMIIIGAGAAGLVAAITNARAGSKVTLLEQNNKIGKKILVSGNGKCNIDNKYINLNRFHSQNPDFVAKVLEGYDFPVVEKFFTSLGLELVEGKEGKMFPMSLQASSVVELLEYEAKKVGVEIVCECAVTGIDKKGHTFTLETSQGKKTCEQLVLASGSPAAPQLGGSNSGYAFATKMGHALIPRHPSLVQLCSEELWVKGCAGVKVAGLAKLYANGEYITEKKGDLLFTNYGISGLAILDLSREVSTRLAGFDYCELSLDLMPEYSKEKLTNLLLSRVKQESEKPLALWLQGIINKKLIAIILEQSKCKVRTEDALNRKEINKLVHAIKNLKLSVSDTKGFKGAEVATGGIDTSEVNPQTMESKLVPNLFFAGEILDVDGDRGGFNFHWAWVTGLRAGRKQVRKNEIETVKLFLIDLLKIEENQYFKNNEEKIFYLKHKISFTPYNFTFCNEPFYIICQIGNWGIYYNDIEETFGICKIINNKCNESVEFFDNLAPTVRKFKKAYEKNNMESLFE